jgi:pimeloyl-ACP methyl ester carboxylesterase
MGVTFHSVEVGRSTIGVSFDTAAALLGTLGYPDKVARLRLEGTGDLEPGDLLARMEQVRPGFASVSCGGDETIRDLLDELASLALAAQAVGQSISLG